MDNNIAREHLYQKYIEPTKNNKNKFIGVEIELPIVNLSKEAVDFQIVHNITDVFIKHFNFTVSGIDDEGNIFSATEPENGDILSYDCSYNNLELSFGKEKNLNEIKERFEIYYKFLQDEFKKYNYTLTGMGINPYRKYNNNVPIPNGRYRMLYHHLSSYKNYGNLPIKFHNYPEYGMFSSASQVQLDVSYENLTKTINTFSKIEPIKALLFSNSVLTEENEDIICYRDLFWEHSTHGINPHNIGMFNSELDNVDDLLSYIETTSIYCVEREDKYINFTPIPVLDYLNKDSVEGEYYSNSKYEKITVKPNIKDLKYLRTFKFEDLTFRGTIEYRSVCCQPVKDSLTVAAFHLGLSENLDKLADLIENDHILYHHGYSATELRKMFIYNKIPNFLDKDSLRSLTKNILDISKEGLAKRNLNEEKLLDPLYKRNEADTNPAKTMLKLKSQGKSIEDIIIEYGKI